MDPLGKQSLNHVKPNKMASNPIDSPKPSRPTPQTPKPSKQLQKAHDL